MKDFQISIKCPKCNQNMRLEEITYPNIDETKYSASYSFPTSSTTQEDNKDEYNEIKVYNYTCPNCGHNEQILEE